MWFITVLLINVFFDVAYFFRGVYIFIDMYTRRTLNKTNIFDVVVTKGICLTTDMDFMWHMTNSRYLRECDFGRFRLWGQTGVWQTVRKLKGHVTLGFSTIRYRKSLQLWDRFQIKTKVLCWDEKGFYVEQSIVREKDNFIVAIVYVKQAILKTSPGEIVKEIMKQPIESPPFPEAIDKLIQCHQISSESLRKDS